MPVILHEDLPVANAEATITVLIGRYPFGSVNIGSVAPPELLNPPRR